ncbi:MAG: thiol-disulfide oxidoreductase DCC family protein [Krumholzibacteria bacterium]|nr:thiol-disulfide oxidoreductase DCC family protein [Candidatus Krumholzibacteria bacterium]
MVVLFDGHCALCHGFVRFVLKADRGGVFRFAGLDSETGRGLRAEFGVPPGESDTVVVVADGRAYVRSDAVVAVAARLPWPWRALGWTARVPRAWREAGYRWVARNRFRWRPRLDACPVPPPAWRERFLP